MSEEQTGRVIVLGAGGRTGRAILDASLRAGRPTVAVVRSTARAQLAARTGLDVATADARDPTTLQHVIGPTDIIVSAIGATGRDSRHLYRDVGRAVVAATAGAPGQRFVGITSSGVRRDDPGHPWWYRALLAPLMRRTYDDMALMEQTVADSGLRWTFIRPGRLVDGPADRPYRVANAANPWRGTTITRDDVADLAVQCATSDAWTFQHPTLTR